MNAEEVDEANRTNLVRVKTWNGDMKCMRTLNVRSVNRMNLSETDDEIVNKKCVRKSNAQNKKQFEIESESCIMRTVETK